LFAADWPQWRGLERNGLVSDKELVPTTLSSDPKLVWRLEIGGGFSSPVVANGKLAYHDVLNGKETAHLLDAKSGKEIWSMTYASEYQDEWGPGPRSTPIIDGDRVYVQSCNGEFRCLKMADGSVVWGTSFEKDFGVPFLGSKANEGTASRRGNNGCGVIDGERLILPVGGTQGATLVCFNKLTGKVLWKTGDDEAAYSSLMVANLAGQREVVAYTAEGLMGVKLDDGKILWRVPLRTNAKRHAMTPVIFGDHIVVNSHTIGMVCFKIVGENGGQKAEQAWANRDLKINLATPVLIDHHLYCQGADRDYVCVDAANGKLNWRQDGLGDKLISTIGLGKNLLIQTDKGELALVAADPAKYHELGRTQICGKGWNHPAYADGKLFVREGLTSGWKLSCFDLMPQASP
jgi:outer membrane protein assembly factor BamB